ncbi:MAG TPA: Rieske 2Fe-2S domain-containing protein [Ktedonobacteraceae bacterium]|nr:Rieske 2Fe-2S domain-containing protein [Ktedonobacteraceae bacterium]
MKITFLGQAGIFVETRYGSILCDPWFNPAYFASWFPFPSNEKVDREAISRPTYLYLSHLHHDHFDPQFLRDEVWKEATVILPDYPLNLLERRLRELGFTKFLFTKNTVPVEVDGLRFMVMAMTAPIDGPLGDSTLLIDDGEVRLLNQNDSRPIDLDMLNSFGPFDAHFVQFSGAIWYPMVYRFPEKMMQALGRKKRENEMARALRYIREIKATHVVPSAGPPCFLDDHLFSFNDFDRDPTNTFPDQTVFIEYVQANGLDNGRLMIPGTVGILTKDSFTIEHPFPDEEVQAIFTNKRAYLEAYRERQKPVIEALKASWPRGQVDILSSLRDWFEPLMEIADLTAVGINGRVVIDCDVQQIVLDFHTRKVYAWNGEEWDYRFHIDRALLEYCILHHEEDWINQIFLSCRFEAERKGAYNEYVYNFFKCLSPERIQYAEGYYSEKSSVQQLWESHGYRIQRRCPHLKADLARFGKIENGVLTCTMHGWQFELATGRCLTSEGHPLYAQPIEKAEVPASNGHESNGHVQTEAVEEPHVQYIRTKCDQCWYNPKDVKSTKTEVS